MPLNLGDSRQSDGRWSGVAGDGVCIAFDEIAVVAGSFDDAGAGAVADGVSVPEDVAVDPAEGSLVLLRGKNPPAR